MGESRGADEGKTSIERKQAFAPLTTMIPTPSSGTEAVRKAEKAVALPSAASSPLVRRIFLSTALIIAAIVAVTIAVTSYFAERTAQLTVARSLDAATRAVKGVIDGQSTQIETAVRLYAFNPNIRAAIQAAAKDTVSIDALDLAEGFADATGATWVELISAEAVRLARSDRPDAPHDTALNLRSETIARALNGESPRAYGASQDGTTLFTVVGVPIEGAPGTLIGAAVAALNITDSLADRIQQETETEIVFYAIDTAMSAHIVGASRGVTDREMARTTLEPDLFDSTLVDSVGNITMRESEIGGTTYLWNKAPLTTVSGRPVGGVIAFRSKDAVMAPFVTLRNATLGAGVGGLLLAFVLSLAIARNISKPVRTLAIATQRASEGDYAAEIPPGGKDEIGTLSTAFRRLLGDLREKQALVEFLQNPVEGATLPLQAATLRMRAGVDDGLVLEPGRLLGNRYEIKEVLGAGGMGMVYKATDRELGDIVAIKTLRPEMLKTDPEALNRFRSEIRLARLISHRNVVRTHDIGETGGLYYITMEFVEGKSLKDLIVSRGRLPVGVVVPIAKQLCRALEVAHEAGVIHRDIKPQNMVVEGDGVLKVMDFGIARLAQRKADAGFTQAGMVVGTPEYMAPEQLLGDDIDVRADIYSAGVVLYEALTGRVPHTAETPITLIAKVLEETPVSPRGMTVDVPQSLSDLVMRTMAKDRNDRPASAAELLRLLD
jgi:HAMP domain-containing protein